MVFLFQKFTSTHGQPVQILSAWYSIPVVITFLGAETWTFALMSVKLARQEPRTEECPAGLEASTQGNLLMNLDASSLGE